MALGGALYWYGHAGFGTYIFCLTSLGVCLLHSIVLGSTVRHQSTWLYL